MMQSEERVALTDDGRRALERHRVAIAAAKEWLRQETLGRDRVTVAMAREVLTALAEEREASLLAQRWLVVIEHNRFENPRRWANLLRQEVGPDGG